MRKPEIPPAFESLLSRLSKPERLFEFLQAVADPTTEGRYPHWDEHGIKRVHIPHGADASIYMNYGLEKDIDVLIIGNLSTNYYPHRVRLKNIATQILRKRSYRVHVSPHPGYKLSPIREGSVIGIDYAKLINRSKLVVTCSMIHHYALAKYAEIALCRSLAVADVPAERQEYFRSTILEAAPSMLDRTIVDLMESVLDDPAELERRTVQAYDIALPRVTLAHYAEAFRIAITNLLEGK